MNHGGGGGEAVESDRPVKRNGKEFKANRMFVVAAPFLLLIQNENKWVRLRIPTPV